MENRIIGADPQAVGGLIRKIRTDKGITIKQFEQVTGISRSTLVSVELANTRSSLGTLEAIANGLGYRLDIALVKEGESDE